MEKAYYINEYVPAEIGEKRRRERQIFNDNEQTTANKLEMSLFRGGLKIQNQVYKNKVVVPNEADILLMAQKDIDTLVALKVHPGKNIIEAGNFFTGYTAAVSTFKEINELYIHLKLMHPGADHIVCTFNIPGVERHYCANYCDAGETGAGKRILNMMEENNITNRVIFVVRYAGRGKLGAKRFELYLKAAETAVNDNSYNRILKVKQQVNAENKKKKDPKPRQGFTTRGGRGRGSYARTYVPHPKPPSDENGIDQYPLDEDRQNFSFRNPDNPWQHYNDPPPTENWEVRTNCG